MLQFINVSDDLALVGTDSGQHEQILEITVLAERGGFKDDLLEQLDKLDGEVRRQESLDGD